MLLMKKTILSLCGICVFLSCTHSQVLLKSQLPPMGLTLKSQLWNLTLMNTSSQPVNIKIEMLLTNVSNNQKILSGVTREFSLARGTHQVTPLNASPVLYNILSPDYNLNVNQEGFLPVGVFNICYTVLGFNHNVATSLAEECETTEVEPVSPPILVSPSDQEVLEISRPLFNWLPPNPVSLFNNLSYDFTLVEVEKTQSAALAVQRNPPLFARHNVLLNNLQYPLSLPELDTSKLYAWQIAARSGFNPVARSEVWMFRVKKSNGDVAQKLLPDYYTKLNKEVDASFAICYGLLKFSYNNQINDKEVSARIFDITNAKHKELTLDSSIVAVEYGENFKQLDISTQGSFKEKHVYLLDLKNSNEEHWYLKFEYRKPTSKN